MRKSEKTVRHLLSRILVLGAMSSALALAPIKPSGAQEVAPSWSYTGSTNTLHGRTATLLPNGKVLLVGSPNAELYDPSTGTWSVTGSLNVQRARFTATLLGNGKVLVAGGGAGSSGELRNTAELYDPATGEWSFTGNLNVSRVAHTATLLPNGKALFAGGVTNRIVGDRIEEIASNTAELYDPVTGQWSLTGNLSTARFSHPAALLQNGKVLVAGGCPDPDCEFALGIAEVYDPNTETWSFTGTINTARDSATLTMLPNGNVLLSGGQGFLVTLGTTEIYDPAFGRWSATGSLLKGRWTETVTLLPSGEVLVAGGSSCCNSANLGSAELYDPATGKWNATASLNTARAGHTATLLNNGRVLVVGGSGDLSAELYSATAPETATTVSAASYHFTGLSSDSIATSFGIGLATASIAANTLPLPTEIAGTSVKVKDSAGTERLAPLLYVSPTQVNYQIPAGTASGAGTVTITCGNGLTSSGVVLIKPVAPSLFAANGDGQGVAAALALRLKADGSQSYEDVVQFDAVQNRFIARPIDLGPESDQVYLVLFGTGFRSRSSLSAVIASIGGTYAEVSFAGMQPDLRVWTRSTCSCRGV